MSVWRQDAATGDWVIIAPERRARPHDASIPSAQPSEGGCPLCPGNEARTPPALLRLPEDHGKPWKVRVVPNKFALLSPMASTAERREGAAWFCERDGLGHHEVIVDSRQHDLRTSELSAAAIADILEAYHARYIALQSDPRIAYIIVFKNEGRQAGASLHHPHSQLVATPILPQSLQARYLRARAHYNATGECLYCELLDAERGAEQRIVGETAQFVVLCPFASGVPFETWILPKRHQPSYGTTSRAERLELATVLRKTLQALDTVLEAPAFNYVLHTAPVADEDEPYYLWHLQILPRIVTLAGFELGSGTPINTVRPETAAAALRHAQADDDKESDQ